MPWSEPLRRGPRRPRTALCAVHVCAVIFIASASLGCGGPGSGPGDDASGIADGNSDGAAVEIGTGTTAFEPLAAEQRLTLYAGPQGGHHFIVHGRMMGMEPGDPRRPGAEDNPSTAFRAFEEGGERVDVMVPPYILGYRDEGDDWHYLPSGRLLIIEEERVASLFGQRVLIQIHVRDAHGRVAMDQAWVVAAEE